jgi:hypothetical protein
MRLAARTDANHAAVVAEFRRLGCFVLSLAAVGHGCPDLLVAGRFGTVLCEVKDGAKSASRRRLTRDQEIFHEEYPRSIFIITGVGQVPDVILNAGRAA